MRNPRRKCRGFCLLFTDELLCAFQTLGGVEKITGTELVGVFPVLAHERLRRLCGCKGALLD
jgi:hypothetical protein